MLEIVKARIERQWLLSVFIAVGLLCVFFAGSKLSSSTDTGAQLRTDTDSGILVIPVQIDRDNFGLAMVDTFGETLWIYQLNSRGPAYNRLKLFAARSWQYDKLLQQYNTAQPKPQQVKILLQDLSQQVRRQADANMLETARPNSSNLGKQ